MNINNTDMVEVASMEFDGDVGLTCTIGGSLIVRTIDPMGDRVLIQRIEEPGTIMATDAAKSIKGIVLSVGPGKWHPGEWWRVRRPVPGLDLPPCNKRGCTFCYEWQWQDGWLEPLDVKPGMKVLFNSRWNDFSAGEQAGTGADGKGALARPLPLHADPMLHLVQEADIIAIVPHFDFEASIKYESPSQNIEIKGPWNS
jgi:hypothetical protein